MSIILGIESTAHTFGIGIVSNQKILANVRDMYTTESGGIIPTESAKHHRGVADKIYLEALEKANIYEKQIDAIAFSQGPGLAPCLLEGMKFAKELSKKLSKPVVGVNHCVAHLEIGKITGAKDPVLLYCSGANTQVIAYASGKYRVFGETLDIGVGNFIDTIARFFGLGFPGGPAIQKLAENSDKNAKNFSAKNFGATKSGTQDFVGYIELPYKVKGMDVAFSGIQTKLKQLIEKLHSQNARDTENKKFSVSQTPGTQGVRDVIDSKSITLDFSLKKNEKDKNFRCFDNNDKVPINYINNSKKFRVNENERDKLRKENSEVNYTIEDLAFSLQETVFAMLVETAERALAHTGKKELLLGGGVACNSRLQEMCKIMCEERGCKFFVPSRDLLVDNGAMIAYLGEIMFLAGIKFQGKEIDKVDILPRERTDDVIVGWK
ncbi:MAG: hypothetical protein WC584_01330 [Candidatus Pacearchaeota archaeon]